MSSDRPQCPEAQMGVRPKDGVHFIRRCVASGQGHKHTWGPWQEIVPTEDPLFVECKDADG